jgi:NDP-sugar pyrophosphorylase family protein
VALPDRPDGPDTPRSREGGTLAGIDVAVLAGGLGTRLRGVLDDTPKVLAPVGADGRPFLAHLLDRLTAAGVTRVVLCLGHLADRITGWLAGDRPAAWPEVVCVVEPRPLGTAGALRFARGALGSDPVLVLNGDTILDADLVAFAAAHAQAGTDASVLCVRVPDAIRYGQVEVGPGGLIRRFTEKRPGAGTINAGAYLFSRRFLDRLEATGARSLERDALETAPPGTLYAHVTDAGFLDFGTPESLAAAGQLSPQWPPT